MNAADLRRSLSGHYRYDEARRIFLPQRDKPFAYSDGDAAEAYLAQVVAGAADLAVGSPELAAHIRDWPSQYHLSPLRANLLRPVGDRVRGLVLEIGAGCGAITRYLGESGATVLALEGSPARAAIAASRCRDLPNVVVVCDRFDDLPLEVRFDLVTLVGVLEYSRMFGSGDDPVQAMLARAGGYLAPDGVLALAIENQLGLRYLAGAPEDHLGVAYGGVEGHYGPRSPVTFGRLELAQRLQAAGLGTAQWLYPFPDYKLPSVVVTEAGFVSRGFDCAALVSTANVRRAGGEPPLAFSESLAREAFLRNGLGPDTANSFLVVAGRDAFPDPGALAFCYASGRDRPWAKETRFVAREDGIAVLRRPLFPEADSAGASFRQRHADEAYLEGEVLHRGLERLVAGGGWTADALAAWAKPWLDFVRARAGVAAPDAPVAAELFDCTPFNVVRRSDGSLAAFDLEWEPVAGGAPTLARVAFRGLWNSLARLEEVALPAAGVPHDLAALSRRVMEILAVPVDEATLFEWIRAEYAFSREVAGLAEEGEAFVPSLRLRATTALAVPAFAGALAEGGAAAAAALVVRAYLRGPGDAYTEARAFSAPASASTGHLMAMIAVPPQDAAVAYIRVDPMEGPGIFRIEHIALVAADGRVPWETRRCLDSEIFALHQLVDLSELVAQRAGCVLAATGGDPNFEIHLPPPALGAFANGGTLLVEMARLDAAEIVALGRFLELANAYLVGRLQTTPESLASLEDDIARSRAGEADALSRLAEAQAALAGGMAHFAIALRREAEEARGAAGRLAGLDFQGLAVPVRVAQARATLAQMAGELEHAAASLGGGSATPEDVARRLQSLDRAQAVRAQAQAACVEAVLALGESAAAIARELDLGRIRLQAGLGHVARHAARLAALTARVSELEGEVARRQAQLAQLDTVLRQVGHRFVTRMGTLLAPFPALRAALRAPLRLAQRLVRKKPS